MGALVSVIIPTLGRGSLVAAVGSALAQTYSVHEVIIVDASENGLDDRFTFEDRRVRVVRAADSVGKQSQKKWTAAENRNVGVRAASGDWVAFLDDDDIWLPQKTSSQLVVIGERGLNMASCRTIYRLPNGRQIVRPRTERVSSVDVLRAFYGKTRYRRLEAYLQPSSILIKRELAVEIPFPEDVPGFEDTWWFHLLSQRGCPLVQLGKPLVVVNADPLRSIARDSVEKNQFWAEILESVDSDFAANYLLGVCHRNATILGRGSHIRELRKLASRHRRLSFAEITQSLMCGGIARLVAVFRKVRQSQ